jgi:hypothetical protein
VSLLWLFRWLLNCLSGFFRSVMSPAQQDCLPEGPTSRHFAICEEDLSPWSRQIARLDLDLGLERE